MKVDQVHALLARCLDQLPPRYPRPALVLHETPEVMVEFLRRGRYAFQRGYDASDVLGVADAHRNAIHLPITTLRQSRRAILGTLLHEIGHLYAAKRYGTGSAQYTDERRANAFERRWLERLAMEGLS